MNNLVDTKNEKAFDIIIVGGSYAGLSSAMTLGRSLRNVLIIDNGKPCNAQTPHSHNVITLDGVAPKEITDKAKLQVSKYDTVKFYSGLAVEGTRTETGFEIKTEAGDKFTSRKLLFATGVKDQFPNIKGLAECWGISVLHCPYCHGYEVKGEEIGLIGNGDLGFELSKLISNWSDKLTLFTNGKSTLNIEQSTCLASHNIKVIEKEILSIHHSAGYVKAIEFFDRTKYSVSGIFTKLPLKQHCEIPIHFGCELSETGHIKIDEFGKTTIPGIYAAGDCTMVLRSVTLSMASGMKSAASMNKELIDESF